ncbi:MAG: CBS domain-containing protein, partial [Patescibacteria group bacterium]
KYLAKLSRYLFLKDSDAKIYKPYDDKEFKKLITSLHSSDNLVNKKVLSKIEKLFKIEYLTVEDMMIPMSKVTVIDEDEYIGPILLDELHKTSITTFPVSSDGRIIGSVNLSDMKDQTGKTKVKDLAKHEVNYIQEDATTQELVEVFVEYKNEQFLVIDSKENLLGVVNIYQMLELFFDPRSERV